jgi:site-specific recombinase XerD
MRRAFSNHAQEIGKDIYMTQQLMGHDKVTTTEIYLKKNKKGMDELLKSIYN